MRTAEQIAKLTDDKDGLANVRAINRLYRAQDQSHLYPILGKFNATDRAIRKAEGYGLERCYSIEWHLCEIVNAVDP